MSKIIAAKGRSSKIHVWDNVLQVTLCGAELVKKKVFDAFLRQITCPACLEKIKP